MGAYPGGVVSPAALERRPHPRGRWIRSLCAALALAPCVPAAAAPPDEGDCPEVRLDPVGEGHGLDSPPVQIREGMVIEISQLLLLRSLLPPEIWQHREAFFFEGMRMEIGPCHRRYATAGAYAAATERFRGQPRLDDDGNLRDYTAGQPFPSEDIDAAADDAALRWAWNLEQRWRGAGHRGHFRISDLPSGFGGVQVFEGEWFLLQAAARADLPEQDYRIARTDDELWAAGGRFQQPFDARHLAWRQFRHENSRGRYAQSDEIFVYVPSMRKMRRAAAVWVDGLYMPRFTIAGDAGGGAIPFGTELGGAINPTAGTSIAVTQAMKRGLTGIVLRPNAYVWRLNGTRDVIAPLNGRTPGWPLNPERSWGPSGLSPASDRWDVRHAVVIEGLLRDRNETVRSLTVYVDHQTLQPLYWITRTDRRRLLDVGVLLHRFSDDLDVQREWPGGVPSSVFEPVAASFFNALEGRGGWRRESYDLESRPPSDSEARRMLSANSLDRGR